MTPALFDMILRLRGKGISDNAVLKAMETMPRAKFIAPDLRGDAYSDRALPIACGQSLPEPMLIAAMSQSAEIGVDHKVLEIGTGSGYHTAILGQMSRRVYSVERYQALADNARERMLELGVMNAVIRHGDGRLGWRGQAPFDRIIVTAGLNAQPGTLFGQLSAGGKLVAVVDGMLTVYDKAQVKVTERPIFAASLPMVEAGKSKAM